MPVAIAERFATGLSLPFTEDLTIMTIIKDVRDGLMGLSDLDPLPINARLKLLAPVVLLASFGTMAIATHAYGDDCVEVRNPEAALTNLQFSYLAGINQALPISEIQQQIGTPLCKLNNGWLTGLSDQDVSFPSERLAYPTANDPNDWVVLHVLASTGDVYGFSMQRAGRLNAW